MPDIKFNKKFEQPKVQPEAILTPESQKPHVEQVAEQSPEVTQEKANDIFQQSVILPTDDLATTKVVRNEIKLEKVESILSAGMDTIFLSMDAAGQERFKAKGEETAKQITGLLNSAKATVGKIINLIIDWLRIIPRVNRHFLEQEAKIKADQIMSLYKKQ